MSKLKAVQVRSLKAGEKAYAVADGGGLSAHVAKTGVVSWRYRYRFKGKPTTLVIGQYPAITLEKARNEHQKARALLQDGINPTAHRKDKKRKAEELEAVDNEKGKNTFRVVTDEWIDQQSERWSAGHSKAVYQTLKRDVFPVLGNVRVDKISPPQVFEVIKSIESRGSLEIASKVLQRIGAVCRYAVQTGRAMYNPTADMKGALKKRRVQHRAALSQEELPEFLEKLYMSDEHFITKAALMFTIHTAARSGEVRFATWPEINIDDKVWKIPAERMKMRTPHTVPLTKHSISILESMKSHSTGEDGLVFPGIKSPYKAISENTMLYGMYRLGYHSRATVHGFRAVFSTITNEAGLFDKDAIERQLAHQERNKVRAAYHRSEYLEQRRELMDWWSNLLWEMAGGV